MASLAEPKEKRRFNKRFPQEVDELNTSKSNREDIKSFLNSCKSKGLSYTRLCKYLNISKKLAKWTNFDYKTATKKDIEKLVNKIRDQGYMVETEKDYKVTLKYLFKIVYGEDEEYPKSVRWINTTIKKSDKKQDGDVFRDEDVHRIIGYMNNLRDKALFALIYESAGRPSEYLKMKIKNVNNFRSINGILTCKVTFPEGKTGGRTLPTLTDIAPVYLYDWIKKHPDKDNPNAYLFPPNQKSNVTTKHISDAMANKLLKQACKDLKVKKKANIYWLRHSGITKDIREGMRKPTADAKFGWSPHSNTYATYLHLTGVDHDEIELRRKGLLEEEEIKPNQKRCWSCNKINGVSEALCSNCNKPLDLEDMEEKEKAQTETIESMRKQLAIVMKHISEQNNKT